MALTLREKIIDDGSKGYFRERMVLNYELSLIHHLKRSEKGNFWEVSHYMRENRLELATTT